VALVLLAAACGPHRSPEIGFKEVPSDVILGAHATATPLASMPPAGPVKAPPPVSVIALPPPTFDVRPEPSPPAAPPAVSVCATADPLQAPRREAPPQISAPPPKAAYVFRDVGTYSESGANARKGTFPTSSLRIVGNVVHTSDSNFSFDVSELLGTVTTTTTYDVFGTSLVPAALPAGIYIKQIKSVQGGSVSTFAPNPELELAAFPLVRGASVTASGVDPRSATSMQFTSTVTGKTRVDACGTLLDSWVLDLTKGKVISATQNLDFSATYDMGTQYGGLLLRERTAFAGTEGSDGVSRTITATISSTPKLP
jgi:hypothetical protein